MDGRGGAQVGPDDADVRQGLSFVRAVRGARGRGGASTQPVSVGSGDISTASTEIHRLDRGLAHGPIELRSTLPASAELVWRSATSFAGVNTELRPLLRMTHPPGQGRLDLAHIEPGQPLFRSWLLLLGVLPIDVDDITIVEVGPGLRFLERSRMVSSSVWEHEREVRPLGPDVCEIVDRVRFRPRWRLLGPLLDRVVPWVFAHRHRRLRMMFPVEGVAARG